MVTDCDRGIPFVMSHPKSEAAKAFGQIAERCKEYIGFNGMEKKVEKESSLHFGEQQAKR
jgi:MinD-like ATPase involved in chromosome partitioning or flagellar assembly